jgi:hypothetical protein
VNMRCTLTKNVVLRDNANLNSGDARVGATLAVARVYAVPVCTRCPCVQPTASVGRTQ